MCPFWIDINGPKIKNQLNPLCFSRNWHCHHLFHLFSFSKTLARRCFLHRHKPQLYVPISAFSPIFLDNNRIIIYSYYYWSRSFLDNRSHMTSSHYGFAFVSLFAFVFTFSSSLLHNNTEVIVNGSNFSTAYFFLSHFRYFALWLRFFSISNRNKYKTFASR